MTSDSILESIVMGLLSQGYTMEEERGGVDLAHPYGPMSFQRVRTETDGIERTFQIAVTEINK